MLLIYLVFIPSYVFLMPHGKTELFIEASKYGLSYFSKFKLWKMQTASYVR